MKIGILTFHNTTNYGALLQAYALQKVISKRYQCQCEIINYYCKKIQSRELPIKPHLTGDIKKYITKLLIYNGKKTKKKRMRSFEDKMLISEKYTPQNIKDAGQVFDKIFVGSDIVWEPGVTDNDLNYFLAFLPEKKRYSYAASFGNADIPDSIKEKCGDLLRGFEYISVREKSAVNLVKTLSGREAVHVLDPTLLMDATEWFCESFYEPPIRDYILLYFLDKNGILMEKAKSISKKTGMKIVLIHEGIKPIRGVHNVRNCSVEEFLNWFKNAAIIMTASYHGMAFAINFHKEFYYFNRAHAERMISLSEILDLSEQEIRLDGFERKAPDYDRIDSNLVRERNKSLDFLDKCFAEEK